MIASVSVFRDISLPNAATWFYFSLVLAVALFFKFSRLLSVRNFDLIILFLLMPGLMTVQAHRSAVLPAARNPAIHASQLAAASGLASSPTLLADIELYRGERKVNTDHAQWLWYGYLWLMCGTGIFFFRCLIDLILVQRPALAPNLTFGGLAWLALALVASLSIVAFRQPDRTRDRRPETDRSVVTEGLSNPQAKSGPETSAMTYARKYVDPTLVMMRGIAIVGHLAVVLGLMLIGRLHFEDATAGMAAACLYLILPYTGMFVSQIDHVWPMAVIVWALVAYRVPVLAGILLGLATAPLYYPVLLFPIFLSFYWGRGAGRFTFFFLLSLALVLGGVALQLAISGELHASIRRALEQTAWQPWKPLPADIEGFWTGIHAAYRIPVFLAYAAFVIATAFWPMPKNLAHVLALSAAVLIGTQFWYADQGGTYVLWYVPLVLLLMFRGNLADRRPAIIVTETDWLFRGRNALSRSWVRMFRPPTIPNLNEHVKANR